MSGSRWGSRANTTLFVAFCTRGKLIAQGSPSGIKTETFRKPVLEIEAPDPREVADALADWAPAEEIVRAGRLVRVVAAQGALTPVMVTERLHTARLEGSVRAVAPSVEDLFVSFVGRERKARLRAQLRAIAIGADGRACGDAG